MGRYSKGDRCLEADGLYWGFIRDHRDFFLKNHRMSMAVRSYEKMNSERKQSLETAAQAFRRRCCVSGVGSVV